jgi:hypothetical protein
VICVFPKVTVSLKMILPFGDRDRRTPGFKGRQDVIEDHAIAGIVESQKPVEVLDRWSCIHLVARDPECCSPKHDPVRKWSQGRLLPRINAVPDRHPDFRIPVQQ